jgi:fido (protein-threonine AMPylation protein)
MEYVLTTRDVDGATPLDENESDGLIPTHITTLGELNEWEQANIVQAERWAFSRRRLDVLSVHYVRELYKKMFGETWLWAGKFRTTEKTIGVVCWQISENLLNLCHDAAFWFENRVFNNDEAAARFDWGRRNLHELGDTRDRYVAALRAADEQDFSGLFDFLELRARTE